MRRLREYKCSVLCESLERRALSSGDPIIEFAPNVLAVASLDAVATLDAPSKLNVLAWRQVAGLDSLTPFVDTFVDRNPVDEAQRVATLLQAKPVGSRAVMVWGVLYSQYGDWDFQQPASFISTGIDPSSDREWAEIFFAELKSLDAPLERVAMDIETGFNTWNLLPGTGDAAVALMQSIYDDPAAYANLSDSVRLFSPEDFRTHQTIAGRAAYNAWNAWATAAVNLALKAAIAEPACAVFGSQLPVSNYGESTPRGQLLDRNGWPMAGPDRPTAGNSSAPELYLFGGGKLMSLQKDPRWNRLIDALNIVRGCMIDGSADSISPWVSFPSYQGDNVPVAKSMWLWEQLVRHLAASGVSSIYYFNPQAHTSPADDAFANRLFSSLTPASSGAGCTEPIRFDADTITSGDFTTTYEEFLKFVDMPGATNFPPPPPTAVPPPRVSARLSSRSLIITGTAHADMIQLKQAGANVVVFANGSKIGSFSSVKSLVIDAGKGSDSVKLSFDTLLIPATISGGAGNDTLRGSAANDKLYGNAGNDNLFGGAGHDILNGNQGINTLNGSTGDDLIWISPTIDLLIESPGADNIRKITDQILKL